MKNYTDSKNRSQNTLTKLVLAAILVLAPCSLLGNGTSDLLDDFSSSENTSLGFPRMIINDTTAGGKSTSTQSVSDGVLTSKGDIVPPRGQPGWVSMIFMLSADGSPVDVSKYEGVRMKIRVEEGMLSLSANSTEIVNYDYHAAMVQAGGDKIQEVSIPFASMRRAWSEQTKLNTSTIQSLSLVAVGLQKGSFGFEIDEIRFY